MAIYIFPISARLEVTLEGKNWMLLVDEYLSENQANRGFYEKITANSV
jgi:hypothetical protein